MKSDQIKYCIADTLVKSLAKLGSKEQKTVESKSFRLLVNPEQPGFQSHRITDTKDSNFWSVRISRDIRLVVHRNKQHFVLCYVDHHDAAYRWAERRRIETHPTTGDIRLIELQGRQMPSLRKAAGASALLALFLVCGVLIGRNLWQGEMASQQVLLASGTTSFAPTRNGEQTPQLMIQAPITGFVTVISVAGDRSPLVYPRFGGELLRVTKGFPTSPFALPKDTRAVVFVATRTPAGETLRRLEDQLRNFGPKDTLQIQNALIEMLQEYGFREIAVGEVLLSPRTD